MSKWKAGVSRRLFLAHFFPRLSSRPSPIHALPKPYMPEPVGFGSEKFKTQP